MKRKSQRTAKANYERQAEYYDAIYEAQGKNYQKESDDIHALIEQHRHSNGNKLLDIGCGTGGHLNYLKQWYKVEGLDIDERMLRVARTRFPEITFHQGDMCQFDLGKQFDVVTCLFSAIGYARTEANLQRAIRSMSNHLKKGGVLVVEPWFSPDQWQTGKPFAVFADKPDIKIARVNISERRDDTSIVNFHFLVATPGKVDYFTELHELGMFTQEQYLNAFIFARLDVTHDPRGITGRGLYIGKKMRKID